MLAPAQTTGRGWLWPLLRIAASALPGARAALGYRAATEPARDYFYDYAGREAESLPASAPASRPAR
jgi:hypothetical protein